MRQDRQHYRPCTQGKRLELPPVPRSRLPSGTLVLSSTHVRARIGGKDFNDYMTLVKLSSRHAEDAARLHIAGQPGTFLTSLGPDVLTILYRALPESATGFGYA